MKHKLAIAAGILNQAKLPKIPNEVARLQDESLHPNPNAAIIAQCINRNPKLLTRFLAVASFISKKEVNTARYAVDVLGIDGVFTLFFSNAIEFIFESSDNSSEIINHSIKIGIAIAELSSPLKISKSDCYLFGMLFNVGYIVLNRHDKGAYETHYLQSLLQPSSAAQRELDAFGTTANYIGVYVAKKWHVKNFIYSAILLQHSEIEKDERHNHHVYEMVNLLHIARAVVANAEDKRFMTKEIQSNCARSMTKLGISNHAFAKAQHLVTKSTKDLKRPIKRTSTLTEMHAAKAS